MGSEQQHRQQQQEQQQQRQRQPPPRPPTDGIWAASCVAALFPAWGLALAHKIGSPPLTHRLVDWVFHRGGGPRAFIAAPVITTATGFAYLQGVSAATSWARRAEEELST